MRASRQPTRAYRDNARIGGPADDPLVRLGTTRSVVEPRPGSRLSSVRAFGHCALASFGHFARTRLDCTRQRRRHVPTTHDLATTWTPRSLRSLYGRSCRFEIDVP